MKRNLTVILVALAIASCTSPNLLAPRYETMSSSRLWTERVLADSPMEVALIEAELGSRGETTSGTGGYTFLGENTAAAYGKKIYSRKETSNSDVNCDDFPSSGSAQKYFLRHGGPQRDPNGLDRDGDGLACEWGTYLREAVRKAKSLQASRSISRRARSTCYTGPRGGTYTLTASGNKNYDGC